VRSHRWPERRAPAVASLRQVSPSENQLPPARHGPCECGRGRRRTTSAHHPKTKSGDNMITSIKTHAATALALAITVCTFSACSQYAPPESDEVGSVELALRSTSGERSYELRNT